MDANQVTSVSSLFSHFGRTLDLAEATKQPLWRVEKWRQRGRIPPEYWASVCDAFTGKGIEVSVDLLMRLHAVPTADRRAG